MSPYRKHRMMPSYNTIGGVTFFDFFFEPLILESLIVNSVFIRQIFYLIWIFRKINIKIYFLSLSLLCIIIVSIIIIVIVRFSDFRISKEYHKSGSFQVVSFTWEYVIWAVAFPRWSWFPWTFQKSRFLIFCRVDNFPYTFSKVLTKRLSSIEVTPSQ